MSEKIMPNRLDLAFFRYQEELESKALQVLRSGHYVLGPEVENFEREFAAYIGSACCVGLASGLDALWLAFRALGIGSGDEVIVPANTYIASVMGITINGAVPVFAEPDLYYNIDPAHLEEHVTERTKAILAVHLYGQSADMETITRVCQKHGLFLVEDCAQSHGASFQNRMTGSFGHIGCFSFYPSKNLGAYGDGGAIVTDDPKIARTIRMYRNYGSERRYYNRVVGANSRLDELQAGLLRVKLKYLPEMNEERQRLAQRYSHALNGGQFLLPQVRPGADSVWHQYVIRTERREQLISHLEQQGIGTIIHYPIPPHLSEAYACLGHHRGEYPVAETYADTVLSLPIYNGMADREQERVIEALRSFP